MTLQQAYETCSDIYFAAKSYADMLMSRTSNVQRFLNAAMRRLSGENDAFNELSDILDTDLSVMCNDDVIDTTLDRGRMLVVKVRDVVSTIESHLDDDGLDDEPENIMLELATSGNSTAGTISLAALTEQLASSVAGIEVISSGLSILANPGLETPTDFLVAFSNSLDSQFETKSAAIRAYMEPVAQVLGDTFLSIPDKISHLIAIVTGGNDSVTEESINDSLSDYTNASVWSAFSATVSGWVDGLTTIVVVGAQTIASIIDKMLGGLLSKAKTTALAVSGVQDTYQVIDRYEVSAFNDFVTVFKNVSLTNYPNLKDKLLSHGGLFTYDTPTARIYICASSSVGTLCEMRIQWKPMLPLCFDKWICKIKSNEALGISEYKLTPDISKITSSASELLSSIFQASSDSASLTPFNNLEAWQSVWLAQFCLALYCACLAAISNNSDDWKSYYSDWASLLGPILQGGKAYLDFDSNEKVGNLTLAEQLRSWSSYTDYSNIDARVKPALNLLMSAPEGAASDTVWLAYSYSSRVARGKYIVMSDSNLSSIARNGLAGVAIALAAAASFIALKGIKKAMFRSEAKAGQLSWNAFDATTGKLTNKTALKAAFKAQRAAGLLNKAASILGGAVSSTLSALKSAANYVITASTGGIKGLITNNSTDVSIADEDITLASIYHKIVG